MPKTPFGEGSGTPLQYSCLENPMDGGAWWAAVYGVTQSLTPLKDSAAAKPLFSQPVKCPLFHSVTGRTPLAKQAASDDWSCNSYAWNENPK